MQVSEGRWLWDNPSFWWQSRAASNFCSCRKTVMKMLLLPLQLRTGMERESFFKKSNTSFQASCVSDFWLFKCLGVAIKGLGDAAAIWLPTLEVLPCGGRGCLVRETAVTSPKFCLVLVYPHFHPCLPTSKHQKYCLLGKSCEEHRLLSRRVWV